MTAPKNRVEPLNSKGTSRRKFLFRSALALSGVATLYTGVQEADNLRVVHKNVHLPNWPTSANGLKIGLISDFHSDYDNALHRVAHSAELLLNENPDIVLLGGDYISASHSRIFLPPTIGALSMLSAAPKGSYAIMGNHDWWGHNAYFATSLLSDAGFTVLNNAACPIPGIDGAYIVGLDDAWAGQWNLPLALSTVPKDALKILALHEPDFANDVGLGFDLQLSGHSHGGQIRLPFLPVLHAPPYGRVYPEGLQMAQNHYVYTTRGIGMTGPQIRTFCDPEVTVLTLQTGI